MRLLIPSNRLGLGFRPRKGFQSRDARQEATKVEGVIAMGMVSDFDRGGAQVLKTTDFLAALPP